MKIRFCSLLSLLGAISAAVVLSACGDSDSAGTDSNDPATPNQGNVVQAYEDLPECTQALAGVQYAVEEDQVAFECKDGDWYNVFKEDKRRNKGSEYDPATGVLTDLRDNQTYRTVTIGDQVWMAENLRFKYYAQNWVSPCYGDDPANCDKYGRLYTVYNGSVVCPKGWHIPDTTEFRILYEKADSMPEKAARALSSTEGWAEYDGKSLNGTDAFGFSLLPGGFKCDSRGYLDEGVGSVLLINQPSFDFESYFVMMFRYNSADIVIQKAECYAYARCLKD